jgi:hypothetical protein
VEDLRSPDGTHHAERILARHGIIVVPSFFDRDKALAAGRRALQVADEVGDGSPPTDQPRNYVVEIDSQRGYYALAAEAHATANLRLGSDAGMLDIFNFDLLDAATGRPLRDALSSPQILDLIPSKTAQRWRPMNLNVYVNRGISHTRMFHADSYGSGQIKAFLYLTDVTSTQDGPYTYVLDSHRPGPFRDLNVMATRARSIFKPTDAPLVDPEKILPIIAPAGSLVVSNQSGFHRGYPQEVGRTRVVSVLNIVAGKR